MLFNSTTILRVGLPERELALASTTGHTQMKCVSRHHTLKGVRHVDQIKPLPVSIYQVAFSLTGLPLLSLSHHQFTQIARNRSSNPRLFSRKLSELWSVFDQHTIP